MFLFQDEDGQSAFDRDPLMQRIGLTICELVHECGGEAAVGLFVRCMASELTEGSDSTQALYQELIDYLPAIIHEGVSRNFQDISLSEAADIPPANERCNFLSLSKIGPPHTQNISNYLYLVACYYGSAHPDQIHTTPGALSRQETQYT